MDVSSLYPNIDHEEGVKACEYALNKRKTPLISTSVLTGLIMTVLKSNTLKFGERFFHQVKGTAMGTPMAVNFANLFMAKFETEMLADYKKKFKQLPTVWLRYIDDIFFMWDYDEASLKHFINFCNNYSSNQNMKSNITFTADYSTSEVYFFDTKIKFKGERLIFELYSKPTVSFQNLHRTSYHPPHTFRLILKSQFIDHEEGVKACEYALNKRKTPLISTSVLTGLIMTVLKSNTLKFGERFFHQLKCTAMRTLVNMQNFS